MPSSPFGAAGGRACQASSCRPPRRPAPLARRAPEHQTAQLGEELALVVGHHDVRRHAIALHAQSGVAPGSGGPAVDPDRVGGHRHQERAVRGLDRTGHHLHAGVEQGRV